MALKGKGTIVGNFFRAIARLWRGLSKELKELIPIAINAIQALKIAMDSPVADVLEFIVTKSIPGEADDIAVKKGREILKEWIPKILLKLEIYDAIANEEDLNKQLNLVLAELKLSPDEKKNVLFHGLASLIIEKLADGELSWSDSIAISEYYYKNFVAVKA